MANFPLVGPNPNGAGAVVQNVFSFCFHLNFQNNGGNAADIPDLYFAMVTLGPPKLSGDAGEVFVNPFGTSTLAGQQLHSSSNNALSFPAGSQHHSSDVLTAGNALLVLDVFKWTRPASPLAVGYLDFAGDHTLWPNADKFGNRVFFDQAMSLVDDAAPLADAAEPADAAHPHGAAVGDPTATANNQLVWGTFQEKRGGSVRSIGFVKPFRGAHCCTDELISHLNPPPGTPPRNNLLNIRFSCAARTVGTPWEFPMAGSNSCGYASIRQGLFKQFRLTELPSLGYQKVGAGQLQGLTADDFATNCRSITESYLSDCPSLENIDQFDTYVATAYQSPDGPVEVVFMQELDNNSTPLF